MKRKGKEGVCEEREESLCGLEDVFGREGLSGGLEVNADAARKLEVREVVKGEGCWLVLCLPAARSWHSELGELF